jgi:outer membrane protein OmpA-like peptidoglycan-associated protein
MASAMTGRFIAFPIAAFLTLSMLGGIAPDARCQNLGMRVDSVMRDTLVETMFPIEHKPLQVGVEGSYGWGWYFNANLTATPAALAGCDFYSSGTGNLFDLKFLAEMPVWGDNSPLSFEPSLFAKFSQPDFSWTQHYSSYDPTTGTIGPFSIRHEVLTTVDELGVGSGFEYELFPNFRLQGIANFGILFERKYATSEHHEPGPLFSNDTIRDTTIGSGRLPGSIFVPSLTLGANYEAPLSDKLRVRPGVEVSVPFGGNAAGSPSWLGSMSFWRAVEVNASLAVLFDLTPRREIVPVFVKREIPVPIQKPQPPTPPKLTASIRAVAISSAGAQSNVVRMTVEEVRTRNADPVLNYIFFDAGSAKFPERYVTYASLDEARRKFQGSTDRNSIGLMDLYRETLNILGDRLRKYPSVNITLIGSTDNTDDRKGGNLPELLTLARKRAEAVRDYLVNVWQIDPKRLRIEATQLPAKPSPSATEAGRAENRRVEFRVESGNPSSVHITDPITVTNIEHLATPDRIDLLPTVQTENGILRTYASISAGGVELQSFSGTAESEQAEKVWAPTEATLTKLRDSLDIDYDVWDSTGNHAHAHSSIPLDVLHVASNRPERIERFSLILFGFDESKLNSNNERSIRSAAEMIPKIPVRRVVIQGYTDETGDPAHNDDLSEARASEVQNRLEAMLNTEGAPLPADIHSEGHGSREVLYDNSLPEGRFFSRTVNITIERAP